MILDRGSQPLGEETAECLDLFWLREAALRYHVEHEIRLVQNEKGVAFLPANHMTPGQLCPPVGVGTLDAALGADGLKRQLEIALLTIEATGAAGNIEDAPKKQQAGGKQKEKGRWESRIGGGGCPRGGERRPPPHPH